MITYISEFHSFKYRPRIQLVIGAMNTLGSVVLPLLAWLILPRPLDLTLFNGYISTIIRICSSLYWTWKIFSELHSWNVYLFVCGLPAFYSAIAFLFLPESPKFLMTIGANEKALAIFQRVYSMNTGKHADSFPVSIYEKLQLQWYGFHYMPPMNILRKSIDE